MNLKIIFAVMLMGITSPALAADDTLVGISALVLLFFLYMLPTFIAHSRDNPRTADIGLLNFLLGWTVLMWVLLFLWAALSQDKKAPLSFLEREAERAAEREEKKARNERLTPLFVLAGIVVVLVMLVSFLFE